MSMEQFTVYFLIEMSGVLLPGTMGEKVMCPASVITPTGYRKKRDPLTRTKLPSAYPNNELLFLPTLQHAVNTNILET